MARIHAPKASNTLLFFERLLEITERIRTAQLLQRHHLGIEPRDHSGEWPELPFAGPLQMPAMRGRTVSTFHVIALKVVIFLI